MADVELGPLSYDTCAGGCAVTAVLHVPRLGPSDMPLPPPDAVPVSVVCDPRAPLTYSSKLRIAVADDNGLEVVVAVGPVAGEAAGGGRVVDAGGEELLAIEPGQKAEVRQAVRVRLVLAGLLRCAALAVRISCSRNMLSRGVSPDCCCQLDPLPWALAAPA